MGRSKNLTRIELAIVIGIYALLLVVLLPNVVDDGNRIGGVIADQANLRAFHYPLLLLAYEQGKLPRTAGGCKFVLAPWYHGMVDKTPSNFERYFVRDVKDDDVRYHALKEQRLDRIWQDEASITSSDTHYAGRGLGFFRGMKQGDQAWMADDCELCMPFTKGSINVLYGDGSVRELRLDPDLIALGYTGTAMADGKPFLVGPGSPHPDLAKLER